MKPPSVAAGRQLNRPISSAAERPGLGGEMCLTLSPDSIGHSHKRVGRQCSKRVALVDGVFHN